MIDRTPRPLAARAAGFTLIEVLIVVAIIGILAAIAYPSYATHVQKTRRADGQLALLEQRQTLERCRALRYTYANCALSRNASPEGFYTLAFGSTPTASTFQIVATATGAQSGDTDCAKLAVDHLDRQLAFDDGDAAATNCW